MGERKLIEEGWIPPNYHTDIYVDGVEQPPKIIIEWMKLVIRQSGGMLLDGKSIEVISTN